MDGDGVPDGCDACADADDTVDTDRGMELDNLEQDNNAEPRSGGTMMNFTLLGKAGELGINPRRGTQGRSGRGRRGADSAVGSITGYR